MSDVERARALVAKMTRDEKIAQMQNAAPAIERLGLPAHDYWNECLHGVARNGIATVFPQAIGMAATWDVELLERVAGVIGDEARAKHHEAARRGERGRNQGLTFWTPNLNLARDPRWGRAQETYGEDPCLSGRLGAAFVRGLQGDDPRHLKVVATVKHFAVHSGPEHLRHSLDVHPSERDLRESYLPHFEEAIREGHPASVMTAYNRLRGEPCASSAELYRILRGEWGWDGFVVSDCGAIDDFFGGHQVAGTPAEAAARAVRAGCDLECGCIYRHLGEALRAGLLSEHDIDRAVTRVMAARVRLGVLDADDDVKWARIPHDVVACDAHRELARETARRSIVLLTNDGVLPLAREDVRRVAVIGPTADDAGVLLGNYHGTPKEPVTILEGIRRALPNARVEHARGCDLVRRGTEGFAEAVDVARRADLVVAVCGLSPRVEGEEGDVAAEIGTGDRTTLALPGEQEALLRALAGTGRTVVVVLTGGSAIASPAAYEDARACLFAWYPGEHGGTAVADVLFGDASPSGRLPVTFYRDAESLPPFESYAMRGRTYRFFGGPVWFPFAHGLSYARFRWSDPRVERSASGVRASVTIENVADRASPLVVPVFASRDHRWLAASVRVDLAARETRRVDVEAPARWLRVYDDAGRAEEAGGDLVFTIGEALPVRAAVAT